MKLKSILLLVVTCSLMSVFAGKILVVMPLPVYSHSIPFIPLFKALAEKGHQVTYLSPFAAMVSAPNLRSVEVNITLSMIEQLSPFQSARFKGVWYKMFGTWDLCPEIANTMISGVNHFLPPKSEKFDLVILEAHYCQEPLAALGHYYNAHVVTITPGPVNPSIAYHTGTPTNPSYIPLIRTAFTDRMAFWDRLKNTFLTAIELIGYHFYFLLIQDQVMRNWLKDPNLPYIGEVLNNVSLSLVETHFSINYARPYLKNVVEIGGISIKLSQPLPPDVSEFMDEAEHGVIYFSWGSFFDGAGFKDVIINVMESFKYVKQRVLFKMPNMSFPDIPNNVLVRPWFPQTSVLGHKKMVLFITHGGLNSISEAIFYGVPVIGTPIFSDQPYNVRLMEQRGVGLYLDPMSITRPSVMLAAMEKILKDPGYRKRALSQALIYRDRPLPMLDEAVYWIEYVMRHRGAPHLRPASLNLPWYQLLLLDIIAFVIAVIATCFMIMYYCIRQFLQNSHISSGDIRKKVQ